MALGAARGNISDIVIGMVALCACRVVTGITSVRACARRVAGSTHTVRTPVVNIKPVIECSPTPGIGIVTLRALTGEVIGRTVCRMAGLAVRLAGVVEDGAAPGIGVMAQRALPGVVISRPSRSMAGLAVCCACCSVVEDGASPGTGVMTLRALPGEMIRWPVPRVTG